MRIRIIRYLRVSIIQNYFFSNPSRKLDSQLAMQIFHYSLAVVFFFFFDRKSVAYSSILEGFLLRTFVFIFVVLNRTHCQIYSSCFGFLHFPSADFSSSKNGQSACTYRENGQILLYAPSPLLTQAIMALRHFLSFVFLLFLLNRVLPSIYSS